MKTTTTRPATDEERGEARGVPEPEGEGEAGVGRGGDGRRPAHVGPLRRPEPVPRRPRPGRLRLLLAVAIAGGGAWHFGKRMTARHAETSPAPAGGPGASPAETSPTGAWRRREVRRRGGREGRRRPPRFVGATWFAKLADRRVALLVQPALEEAEFDGEFPATSFEIATGEASHHVVSVTRPRREARPREGPLAALRRRVGGARRRGDAPVPFGWDEVLARAAANPLRAKG